MGCGNYRCYDRIKFSARKEKKNIHINTTFEDVFLSNSHNFAFCVYSPNASNM